jgi:hypothetical protein
MSAVGLEYGMDAVRHRIDVATNFVQSNSLPLLPDGLMEFSGTARARTTIFDTLFHKVPNVFDRIKVRAAGRPIHRHKPTGTKFLLGLRKSMGTRIILHEGQL